MHEYVSAALVGVLLVHSFGNTSLGREVTEEEAKNAVEYLRRKAIEKVRAGEKPRLFIDLFGQPTRARLVVAGEEEITADVGGAPIEMPWSGLAPRRFYGLAENCIDEDSAQDHLQLGRYALSHDLAEKGAEHLKKALELDGGLADAVNPLLEVEKTPEPEPAPAPEEEPSVTTRPRTTLPPLKEHAEPVHGWEPAGLSGGGAMYTPVISRADPNVMMINCDMSGCYVSQDGGRFWKMVHYKQRRTNTRCKPALHPVDRNVIVAPASWGGTRTKISRDCGETWEDWGNIGHNPHGEMIFDPGNPQLMITGASDGAAISRDGGRSWNRCEGPGGTGLGCHFDQTSPAGNRTIFVGTATGIWRSDDGGNSWQEKTEGIPWKRFHSFCGASNKNTVMLYCSIESRIQDGKFTGGIYRSRDKGETWEWAIGKGINTETKQTGDYADGPIAQYRHVLASDAAPMRVYAFNTSTNFWPPGHPTCFRSDDAGRTWKATLYRDPRFPQYNVQPNYHTASTGQSYQSCPGNAAICPSDPDRLLTVGGMRAFTTLNGGRNWLSSHCVLAPGQKPQPGCSWVCNGLVVTTTWHYYIDPHQHNRHYIAYTDIGFARSLDGGRTWIWWEKGKWAPWRNTCYELAFDPDIPGKVWGAFSNVHDIPNNNIISGRHGNQGPGGVCLSSDFCESWSTSNEGLPVAPCTSVVLDPGTPRGSRTLYAGVFHHGVFKSTDDGKTWTKKSNGLGHPSNMNVYRVILHRDGTLFALITASIGGFREEGVGLYRSKDAGGNWERITNDPVFLWPKDFAVHPENSDVIFLGVSRARNAQQQGLWRTTDGGARWNRMAQYGREHFGAYFHPTRPNWLYLTMCEGAPDAALALSTDGGKTWKPFESFPFGNTQRVTVDPDDPNTIYVTTFGGSVFKGPAAPGQ